MRTFCGIFALIALFLAAGQAQASASLSQNYSSNGTYSIEYDSTQCSGNFGSPTHPMQITASHKLYENHTALDGSTTTKTYNLSCQGGTLPFHTKPAGEYTYTHELFIYGIPNEGSQWHKSIGSITVFSPTDDTPPHVSNMSAISLPTLVGCMTSIKLSWEPAQSSFSDSIEYKIESRNAIEGAALPSTWEVLTPATSELNLDRGIAEPQGYQYQYRISARNIYYGAVGPFNTPIESSVIVKPACIAANIEWDKYEMYYGDFNQDGISGDVYFHGSEIFVPIHGDILIPIFLDAPPSFAVYSNQGGYSVVVAHEIPEELLTGLQKLEANEDFSLGDVNGDGLVDVIIKGQTGNFPDFILAASTNYNPEPIEIEISSFDSSSGSIETHLRDVDNDGVMDLVYFDSASQTIKGVYSFAGGGVAEIPFTIKEACERYESGAW